mgnify:CR=1 FL=1
MGLFGVVLLTGVLLSFPEIHYPIIEIFMLAVEVAMVFISATERECTLSTILAGLIAVQVKQNAVVIFHKTASLQKEGKRVQHQKIVIVPRLLRLHSFEG